MVKNKIKYRFLLKLIESIELYYLLYCLNIKYSLYLYYYSTNSTYFTINQ